MFTAQREVGRLVVARVFRLETAAHVAEYAAAFGPCLTGVATAVLCADHRPVAIYPPAAADALIDLFRTLNPKWDKVAILVARSNATLALQVQRIVRESGNPSRRVFFGAADAERFLAPDLSAAERVRLVSFLAERVVVPAIRRGVS